MPSYKVEYHRVWVKTVEAKTRDEARTLIEEEMSEEPDAEDYSYSVVKRRRADRDSGEEGHNSVWGTCDRSNLLIYWSSNDETR